MFAEVFEVGSRAGLDLGHDAFIRTEQRKVAVCRRAGNDVDHSRVVEFSKALDNVPAERFVIIEGLCEIVEPPARR